MSPLKIFMRGWSYNLKRSTRNNFRLLLLKAESLIRQRVPSFDRRRKA